ncbi:hypothetical protein B296_00057603 [Ensete ventricosum]|uniref:Uncharacterized protein n=1 Tax=Ensete ventricosum TaxID=4639 RepID=A0A426XHT0_ENSVE|nr:hypothetical protein B296_00057603 [Ensete ventricosum]
MNETWLVEASLSPAPHAPPRSPLRRGRSQWKPRRALNRGIPSVSCGRWRIVDRLVPLIDRVHDAGRLVRSQHERILAFRAANKELKHGASQDLVTVAELHVKELQEYANKLRVELESLKSQRRDMEQKVGVLRSSLDGAWNDRVRFEGDVLSLPDAAALLKAELKAEGPRAVAAYKASRGFESGLEKMGRVSYEFGYRVALERLRGRHPEIMIELDLFTKCPNDANVKMDLNQLFDDHTPSRK